MRGMLGKLHEALIATLAYLMRHAKGNAARGRHREQGPRTAARGRIARKQGMHAARGVEYTALGICSKGMRGMQHSVAAAYRMQPVEQTAMRHGMVYPCCEARAGRGRAPLLHHLQQVMEYPQ